MASGTQIPRHHFRRLMALMLVAWLNLMAQPTLAAVQVVPAGMEHCDHAGDCPAMRPIFCTVAGDVNVESQRTALPPRAAPLLVLLPAETLAQPRVRHAGHTLRPPITGPPLTIRFCHLRN